ncbi:MAG: histidine triad nucleotide-binding protein [Candidatus Omnitrophota bacterium]|nr:histidine triad nucleotide-binding protein [Candidatus Omnitrophota bacterium]MBU1894269.1 histidine triad nucleotide-binding protein [Candidatus Omnitrophota bacterium]
MNDCIFCKIANKEIETKILYEDEQFIAFEDVNKQAPVHFLIIPKKHIETLNDVSDSENIFAQKILSIIKKTAGQTGVAETGYRIVINCNRDAGQEVLHLHIHVLGGRTFSWPPG